MDFSKYYSIVVVVSNNESTKEHVMVDYDDDYMRVFNIFKNINELSRNNIYSDNVISIILRRITIQYNHIVTEDVMTMSKNNDWKIVEKEL